jgi:prepilin-type N-terminal cleavage/methylation domain-containing protein
MGGEPLLQPTDSAVRRNNARAGFTLLETLVALAIAAAAFAVIVDFSMRTLRNWHRGDQAIAAMEMLTRGISRLQADLAVSLPMGMPGGDGSTVLFKGDAGNLVFAAATGFGSGNRGVELISISALSDSDGLSLVRSRGPVANPQPELRDPVVLMRGRMQIRFSYRDRNGKTAPTWIEQPEMPAAVAVEIFGAEGNPIMPVAALLALPQNFSVECFNPAADQSNIQVRCSSQQQQQQQKEQETGTQPSRSRPQ